MSKALKTIFKKMGFNWQTEILAEYSLEEEIKDIKPKIKITIRRAQDIDLDKFRDITEGRKFELFRERFEKGRICLIAIDRNKIAYYGWISFGDEYDTNCQIKIKLNEEEAYWFDCYTMPEYRKMGLHTAVTAKALAYIKNKGYKRVLSVVTVKNIPSRKAFEKVGFRGKKIVTLIRLFGLNFHIWREFKKNSL